MLEPLMRKKTSKQGNLTLHIMWLFGYNEFIHMEIGSGGVKNIIVIHNTFEVWSAEVDRNRPPVSSPTRWVNVGKREKDATP